MPGPPSLNTCSSMLWPTSVCACCPAGCGFGTRPWRLPFSSNVAWFDVDLPSVMEEKARRLAAVGAEMHPPEPHFDLRQQAGSGDGGGSSSNGGAAAAASTAHPLRVGSYTPVVCHMIKGDLAEALQAKGWDPAQPTIWVACECSEGGRSCAAVGWVRTGAGTVQHLAAWHPAALQQSTAFCTWLCCPVVVPMCTQRAALPPSIWQLDKQSLATAAPPQPNCGPPAPPPHPTFLYTLTQLP